MIDTLILDFGGVISKTLFETQADTEQSLGLPVGSLQWRGPFDPNSDQLWQQMQNDIISERDYWLTRSRELGAMIGEEWHSMAQMLQRIRGDNPDSCIRPEARASIEKAYDKGVQLAILSNELDLFYGEGFSQKLPLLQKFDVIHDATYTHILKPAAQAYRNCLQKLQRQPQQCVFVDDQQRNINAAIAIGLHCVHFDVQQPSASYQQALKLLAID